MLHQQAPGILVGTLISTGTITWLMWDADHHRQDLIWWLVTVYGVVTLRALQVWRYWRDPARLVHSAFWSLVFTVGSLLSGLCMGYLGWHFFNIELLTLFPITLILSAIVGLSVPSAGVYLPAHAVFNLSAMGPFMVRNLLEGERLFYGQSFAIGFMMISCMLFARRQHRNIRQAIELRFANAQLAERLTQEHELALEALEEARQANAAKSRFLAATSHDLRQPLQAQALFLQALEDDLAMGRTPDARLMQNLRLTSDNLSMLLNTLLDLSRMDIGDIPVSVQPTVLGGLFASIEGEFGDLARAKGLRLRVVACDHVVDTDPALLLRMLSNLTSNALRYTEQGAVMLVARRRAGRVMIEVRDSGVGIAEDAHDDIFLEFHQQGNPERDRRKGLGLGLAIVRALSRQLDHPVSLSSCPGAGSTFRVSVPLSRSMPAEVPPLVSAVPDQLYGALVAVIDDEELIREAMAHMLRNWGCQVVCAENAGQLLELLGQTPPTVILADWRLREGRLGPDEARKLHEHFDLTIPTLIITGDTARDESLNHPFPVCFKPIQGYKLRARLMALLNEAR